MKINPGAKGLRNLKKILKKVLTFRYSSLYLPREGESLKSFSTSAGIGGVPKEVKNLATSNIINNFNYFIHFYSFIYFSP